MLHDLFYLENHKVYYLCLNSSNNLSLITAMLINQAALIQNQSNSFKIKTDSRAKLKCISCT